MIMRLPFEFISLTLLTICLILIIPISQWRWGILNPPREMGAYLKAKMWRFRPISGIVRDISLFDSHRSRYQSFRFTDEVIGFVVVAMEGVVERRDMYIKEATAYLPRRELLRWCYLDNEIDDLVRHYFIDSGRWILYIKKNTRIFEYHRFAYVWGYIVVGNGKKNLDGLWHCWCRCLTPLIFSKLWRLVNERFLNTSSDMWRIRSVSCVALFTNWVLLTIVHENFWRFRAPPVCINNSCKYSTFFFNVDKDFICIFCRYPKLPIVYKILGNLDTGILTSRTRNLKWYGKRFILVDDKGI